MMDSNNLEVHLQEQNFLVQFSELPCEKHPEKPISKVCKHPKCNGQLPFCGICFLDHDIMHFSYLEDIETLINPQKMSKVKEIAQILKGRIDQNINEDGTSSYSSSIVAQFRKFIEQNKAKLRQCLINNIIAKKDDELKLELRMISDRMCRKFVLLAETKGEDPNVIRDYLFTYAHGIARLSEISELIRNQTAIMRTNTVAKKYLQGVEEIIESVRRYTRPIIGEMPRQRTYPTRRRAGSRIEEGLEMKDEYLSRLEDNSNFADTEYDAKFSESTPRRSTSRKFPKEFLTSGKEPKPYKRLKYNPDHKALSKSGTSTREINCKKSEADENSSGANEPSANLPNDELIEEKYENDSQEESDEKARRDYRTWRYPKPIKDFLRLLFSLRMNRKYIQDDINVALFSVRKISKKELKKAIDIISQINRILTSSNKSTPDSECASQVQKLSKAFYDVIPFNQAQTLNDIQKLKNLTPMLESLCALRVTLNMMLGPKEDPNRLKNHYRKLNCQIEELSLETKEYGLIEGYFKKTAPYNRCKIEEVVIQSVLKISREEQERGFPKDIPNKMLLWCGARFTDVVKILRHGFQPIANLPEDLYEPMPHVKFVDMVSNCLAQCHTSPENNIAFLFLCEVALGEVTRQDGQNPDNNSDSSQFIEIDDGVKIPIKDLGLDGKRVCRRYDIFYFNRIKIRYLFHCQIKYQK